MKAFLRLMRGLRRRLARLGESRPEIEYHRDGAWHFAVKPDRGGGFVAWGKMGPIKGTSPMDDVGADIWFEFGWTADEALRNLKVDLGLIRR